MIALVEDLVRRARRAGADEAEAYYEDRHGSRIELRNDQIVSLSYSKNHGIGLRVLIGGAAAYAYTPDLSPRSLHEVARQAVALAREAAPDPARSLFEPRRLVSAADLDIFDPQLATVESDQKVALIRRAVSAVRAEDERVGVDLARYRDTFGTIALANSRGLAGCYQRSDAVVSVVTIARDNGTALRASSFSAGHGIDQLEPEEAGARAARRATEPLGGRPISSRRATVVMEPEVGAELLRHLARALSGDAVQKGRSMLAGLLGKTVGSELLSIVDQGNLPAGLGSAPFDGEGVPAARTLLVDQGVLTSFLHTCYTAQRAGVTPTGNALRQGYRSGPEVGPTNLFLAGGSVPRSELVAGVERGLLVTSTRNVGGINAVNGDYSVGAAGVWLENGQKMAPVSGVTIAGSLGEMLNGLVAVADDLRWIPAGSVIGCPTLRIEGMMIAGS